MGYTNEFELENTVKSIIATKIKSMVNKKFNLNIADSKEYVFDNKKYYLKEDINKGLNKNIDLFSEMLINKIQNNLVDIKKIKSTNIGGREVKGQRLFYHENINQYIDSVLSGVLI